MGISVNMKRFIITLVFLAGTFAIFSISNADMQSASYRIMWDSVNSGGYDDSSSTSYNLRDSIGQISPGVGTSASYELRAGYRQDNMGTTLIQMAVEAQAESPETTFSAFDDSGLTVTIADSANFSTNDYILVVENEGESQNVAVGQIASITGVGPYVVTVDKWSGDNAVIGASGVIYELNGLSASLGTLRTSSVRTRVAMVELTTNALNGYTCAISEDTDLISGTKEIDDVGDGTVTVGEEEYGIEKTGDNVAGAGSDVAITSTKVNIASSTSAGSDERTMAIYKAAISSSTTGGSYSHTTSYYCTANF